MERTVNFRFTQPAKVVRVTGDYWGWGDGVALEKLGDGSFGERLAGRTLRHARAEVAATCMHARIVADWRLPPTSPPTHAQPLPPRSWYP